MHEIVSQNHGWIKVLVDQRVYDQDYRKAAVGSKIIEEAKWGPIRLQGKPEYRCLRRGGLLEMVIVWKVKCHREVKGTRKGHFILEHFKTIFEALRRLL